MDSEPLILKDRGARRDLIVHDTVGEQCFFETQREVAFVPEGYRRKFATESFWKGNRKKSKVRATGVGGTSAAPGTPPASPSSPSVAAGEKVGAGGLKVGEGRRGARVAGAPAPD